MLAICSFKEDRAISYKLEVSHLDHDMTAPSSFMLEQLNKNTVTVYKRIVSLSLGYFIARDVMETEYNICITIKYDVISKFILVLYIAQYTIRPIV